MAPEEKEEMDDIPPPIKIKELYILYQPISKIYTDDCGRFPIRSRSINKYITIAYNCDSNTILQAPFTNRKDKHRIIAYNSIMRLLADRGHQDDVQILNNEISASFKRNIVEDWGATYQLVPPNVHRINISKRAIYTFKANILSVLSGVDPNFPKCTWDKILVHTDLALILLCLDTLNPSMSAWKYFNGAFDYAATPLCLTGCKIIIHTTPNKRKYCDQRG